MSIHQHHENCHMAVTAVESELSKFVSHQKDVIKVHDNQVIHMHLSLEQTCLLAAFWPSNAYRKLVILDVNATGTKEFLHTITHWEKFFGVNGHCHLFEAGLTEQERSGDVYTPISTSYHLFLSHSRRYDHFIVKAKDFPLRIPNPAQYRRDIIVVTKGERSRLHMLAASLVERGYIRTRSSLEPGSFRIRGEVLEVNHPLMKGHITITCLGNAIESIVHHSGRRSATVASTRILPMRFPAGNVPFIKLAPTFVVFRPHHLSRINGTTTVITDSLTSQQEFPILTRDIIPSGRLRTFILFENKDRVTQYAHDHPQMSVVLCKNSLAHVPIALRATTWQLTTERKLFPQPTSAFHPIDIHKAYEMIGTLQEGKPAVHVDHGIGIYEGLQKRLFDNSEREYLILRFAEGDSLSVPVEYAHKVTPYIGDQTPALYRLGGTAWSKARKKAGEDAVRFAQELLTIARHRRKAHRAPFVVDDALEKTLEHSFPFTLTADQQSTWEDVKRDMKGSRPMDRLVVGDVGFGKTEIALRAARHAVNNAMQVAILAPTTLLVQQHFDTFRQRLSDVREHIYVLSRFVSQRKQQEIKQAIQNGSASIIIGTHALLGPSIRWQNLGLVIIDEEQRFGVAHKEHFKKVRSAIDALSITATPIPRTLSMALAGLRSLSVISSPPEGRKSAKISIHKVDDSFLKHVITKELTRKGQIYVVAPKIKYLAPLAKHIAALIPSACIAIAHGRLHDRVLSGIIHDFDVGTIDILVCSSIVENGLDLANANTMIVWHSPSFGLADLYQLKGRIGRRVRQGYALFLYDQTSLTPSQRMRLAALTQASRLGSGWEIARRDLEIRGAGNILGAQQSGSVRAVGVQLYLDMVHQLIEPAAYISDTLIEVQLPVPAIIPIHYIENMEERTRWYVRLSRSRSQKDLKKNGDELEATYGTMPPEVQSLVLILTLQRMARRAGIEKIACKTITPQNGKPFTRLEVSTKDKPKTLHVLQKLGHWKEKEHMITLDVEHVSIDLAQKMVDACIVVSS